MPLAPYSLRLPLQFLKHVYLLGWEPEIRHLGRITGRGGVAVDAGANIGLYSYALARCGRFSRILAFEPNRAVTRDLERAQLANLQIHHVALSAATARSTLRIPRIGRQLLSGWSSLEETVDLAADQFRSLEVPTLRLDDLGLGGVGFIKIDVEGHELALLNGAGAFFRTNRPACLIECRDRNLQSVDAFFSGLCLGYARIDTRQTLGFDLSPGNYLYAVPCSG